MLTRRRGRPVRALARAAVALALAAAGAAGGTASGAAQAGPAGTAATVPAPASRTVALVTGQRLLVGTTGRHVSGYRMLPQDGPAATLVSFGGGGGDTYAVPADVLPEVGRRLDLSLFDVTALARQSTAGGRTPLDLTFAAGTPPAAPPGVRLTSVTGSTATGVLDPGSAAAFGRAVRERRLPPALESVRLGGTGTGTAARPHFPLHTLRISARGLSGGPGNTPLGSIVLNTDDVSRFGTVVPVENGEGNVQVPAGHYAVYTLFVDRAADGAETAWREVAQDTTVAEDGPDTTVAVEEAAADRRVTVTTPQPATADVLKLTWFRTGPSGNVTFDSVQVGSPATVPVYVNARPAAAAGSRYVVQWGGAAPDGGAYRYDVAFGSDDVPADQAFRAEPGELATVEHRFSADPAAGGAPGSLYVLPVDGFTRAVEAAGQTVLPPPVDQGRQAVPGSRTEYVGTADGGGWAFGTVTAQLDTFDSDTLTLAPGSTRTVDWAHGPLAPGLGTHHDQQVRECTACAGGGQFTLYLPTGDSEPDHVGSVAADTDFTLSRDGTRLVDEPDVIGARVSAGDGPADYRAVLDTDRSATGAGQSVRTRTELAFHDPGRGADPGLDLPADVPCPAAGCRIMPALTLTYRLDTDPSNTGPEGGTQGLDLTVGHLSYDGRGSHAPVTSATVSVSFDGGATWQPAALTGSAGNYHADWRNTGTAAPSIEVTAADGAGGSITQTVTAAYGIAPGSTR
ncbi:hypothetical protein [Streptomyces sp. NRRL F-5123]|uniref:hypothetical protein n=1 Tax=Streptomyces sp. NRRL F-5123 TaxID=1463856 RepID=UPI0004E1922A|nr:hypothetical protein [Streptomyces sp. NRRL F-5123]